MASRRSNRCIFCLLLAVIFLQLLPATGWAQVFSQADDTRVVPPEKRTRPARLTLQVQGGATLLEGNVEHIAVNGALSVGLKLYKRHEIFLDGRAAHSLFDGEAKIDKDSGSLLYVLALASHWNLYFQSTHSRNKFLELTYRTTNSLGGCFHGFGAGILDPILVSLGVTPENEWWIDGSTEFAIRLTPRITARLPVGEAIAFGADVLAAINLEDGADLRLFIETYLEVKLWKEILALRLTLTDKFDSRPRPGVSKNDLSFTPSLVFRLGT